MEYVHLIVFYLYLLMSLRLNTNYSFSNLPLRLSLKLFIHQRYDPLTTHTTVSLLPDDSFYFSNPLLFDLVKADNNCIVD